jgi:hypothetical protein
MISGSPVTPSVTATQLMVVSHSMGMNPCVFLSGRMNHDTQPIPWDYNHFSYGMPNMSSHFLLAIIFVLGAKSTRSTG